MLVEGREWHHILSGSDSIVKLQGLVDDPKALLYVLLTMLSVDDLISACKAMIFACKSICRSWIFCDSPEKESFDVDCELRVYILASVICLVKKLDS